MCSSDIFLGVIAILFPPLAVWVKCGLCSADSIINILLCVLGYIPGLLHAWYIIAKFPESDDYERVPQQDYERGQHSGHGHSNDSRVHYVFVQAPSPQPQPQAQSQAKHSGSGGGNQPNYGTTASSAQGGSQGGSRANNGGEGGSGGEGGAPPPPTYAEAVKGDHKVQSDE
ncbi:hypothetical protein F4777DRAFT_376464 [Nemania sp. FL0916]|nr:hypothetical protein F4777DRAFT_376464 [Nemania sp. FL0916]